MFIIETQSSFSKAPLSDSQGQFHAQCMWHYPAANVLSHGVICIHPVLGHFKISPPFSGEAFKVPLLCCCAGYILHLHLAFCMLHVLGGWPEDKAVWRVRGQTVHVSCFVPSTLPTFLRQHVRNLGEQYCSVRCKQVFGDALTSEHRKYGYMRWKWRGCLREPKLLKLLVAETCSTFVKLRECADDWTDDPVRVCSEMQHLMVEIKWRMYSTPPLKFKGYFRVMCTTFHIRFNCD